MRVGGMGDTARVKFSINWPIQMTSPTGSVTSLLAMNPGSTAFPALNYIAQCYNNFRFENIECNYVSNLSLTSSGVFYGCFLNNPEVMGKAVVGSITNLTTVVQNTINTRSAHVTDNCTFRDTLPNRRRWYSTDTCVTLAASPDLWNTFDRAMQSLLIVRVEGAPATVIPGTVRISGTCVFEGLSPINLAIGCETLLRTSEPGTPNRRTMPDGRVVVYDPATGTTTIYDPPVDTPTVLQHTEVCAHDTA